MALSMEGWAASVRLAAAPEIAQRLAEGLVASPPRSLWMTDLLNPRVGYFRRVSPVPASPERQAVQEVGKELHLRIGALLAPARYREVRRHRDDLVAQLDLFEEVPTEIKSTEIPDRGAEEVVRSSYLDQLGMYCALVGRPEGRLILVDRRAEATDRAAVFDVTYDDPTAIWAATRARAGELRSALDRKDPSALPRCVWFGRGCEFQDRKVCPCTGEEPPLAPDPLAPVQNVQQSAAGTERLRSGLRDTAQSPPPTVRRFRDLLYPRRSFFERTAGYRTQEGLPPLEADGLFHRISDVLDDLGEDQVARFPVPGGEPLEAIPCWNGEPYLLKVSRARSPPTIDAVPARQPQYLLELGLRCAALSSSSGLLIVGYERLAPGPDQVLVYRVRFDPPDSMERWAHARRAQLSEALAIGSPIGLPACPDWMYSGCPYRENCGCGPTADRSQR